MNETITIGIEGNTCTGKTVLAKGIVSRLQSNGIASTYVKLIPSVANRAQIIAQMGKVSSIDEDLLFLDDLVYTIRHSMEAEAGKVIVFDRYAPSKVAYTRTYRSNQGYQAFMREMGKHKIVIPDLMFLLQASSEVKRARLETKTDTSRVDLKTLEDSALESNLLRMAEPFNPVLIDTSYLGKEDVLQLCLSHLSSRTGQQYN